MKPLRHFLVPALLGLIVCAPASAFFEINDHATVTGDQDLRPGLQKPSAQQLSMVKSLGVTAKWNRYGTVQTLMKPQGFLAEGLAGSSIDAARAWVRSNKLLFKLSDAGVDDLEVVNEGEMPFTEARAVLFRQRFGGFHVTRDGMIAVGISKGRVYYASSSSAGDQPLPGAVSLTPQAAWLKAAANINRFVKVADITETRDKTTGATGNGWNLLKVLGFKDEQRVRLVALPMPAGGVRQAYETIVLDNSFGIPTAVVHLIDAETGAVLIRENHLYNASATPLVPSPFSGNFTDLNTCDARHEYDVASGSAAVNVITTMVVPTNSLEINLYLKNADGTSTLVATGNKLTGPAEVITYAPSGGVPAGTYEVEACLHEAFEALSPYNYVGAFLASPVDTSLTSPILGADANAPQWKWFPSNPDQTYAADDIRKVTCFAPLPEGGLGGCDIDSTNTAARGPWDTLLGGLVPTFTTIGNAAITAGDSISPLTPSIPNLPLSPTRKYDFPFNNAWHDSGCSPVGIITSQIPNSNGNDLSAVTVNLFTMHNRMHDFAYFLGFTERNYNLQLSNYGLTPITQQNDPEIGQAQAGSIGGHPALPTFGTAPGRDNANQIALMDGVPGITNQYLFQPVGGVIYPPCTDGALDMGVAGHEYTHAISNRMVGGPDAGLTGEQAGSMGESWSDLNATEYQLENGFFQPEGYNSTALGAYTTGNKERGIRDYPLDNNPMNYSNLGFDTPGPEVHADGEIWNGTQWELRQAFVDKYQDSFDYNDRALQKACASGKKAPEDCPGNRRWIQLVYDAWLLMPGHITMLDARDAMLAADMARFGGANQEMMWRVFAHRGMGKNAYSSDADDPNTIPSFESPMASDQAEVTFKVLAGEDDMTPPITNARILVGRHATRTRQIADTDPATVVDATDAVSTLTTLINQDNTVMVPATYEFIVVAPGYGIHSFTQELKAGKNTLTFTVPTNWASSAKGATVTTSATDQANIDAGGTLIDDSEDTGAVIGDNGLNAGAWATVALGGGEHTISAVALSMAAGPTNSGRWGAVRSFEIRTCDGECTDPAKDFDNIAYTSAPDAFPGGLPRPLQPDFTLRTFSFPAVTATHVQMRVLQTQCTGGPLYVGDSDSDPLNNPDCVSAKPLISALNAVEGGAIMGPAPASYARATDIQVYTDAPATLDAKDGLLSGAHPRFGGALGGLLLLPLMGLAALRRRLRR